MLQIWLLLNLLIIFQCFILSKLQATFLIDELLLFELLLEFKSVKVKKKLRLTPQTVREKAKADLYNQKGYFMSAADFKMKMPVII